MSFSQTQGSILNDLMERHFPTFGPWNDNYQGVTESGFYFQYAEQVARTLLRPNSQGLQQATPLIRDFVERLQSLAWTYGEHNIKNRIAFFLIRENALFTETGTEVTDPVTPEVLGAVGNSKVGR